MSTEDSKPNQSCHPTPVERVRKCGCPCSGVGALVPQIAVAVVCLPSYIAPMQAAAELKQMTVREKIQLMEALWDDLCEAEETIPVPDWHKAVLDEREREVAAGEAKFVDWDAAKERIAKRVT